MSHRLLVTTRAAPANTALPVVVGTTITDAVLTSDTGSWSANPTSFVYQWKRYLADGVTFSANVGTNAATYTLVGGDVGFTIRCEVTASNAFAAGSPALSVATAVIAPPPYPAGVVPGIGAYRLAGSYAALANKPKWVTIVVGHAEAATLNLNQTCRGLVYMNPSYVDLRDTNSINHGNCIGCTSGDAIANTGFSDPANDWLAYTSGNALIPGTAYANARLTNPGSPGFQNAFATKIYAYLQQYPGLDGVFFDNTEFDYRNLVNAAGDVSFKAVQFPTQASWKNAMVSCIRFVSDYLQDRGYYVAVNAKAVIRGDALTANATYTSSFWADLSTGAGSTPSAFMVEHWLFLQSVFQGTTSRRVTDVQANSWGYWTNWVALIPQVQSVGSDYIAYCWAVASGTTGADDALWKSASRYVRASFLLYWDGTYGVVMANRDHSDDGYTGTGCVGGCYDWSDLGQPTGPPALIAGTSGNGVWRRDFDHGYVVVNPSTSSYTGSEGTVPVRDSLIHLNP